MSKERYKRYIIKLSNILKKINKLIIFFNTCDKTLNVI